MVGVDSGAQMRATTTTAILLAAEAGSGVLLERQTHPGDSQPRLLSASVMVAVGLVAATMVMARIPVSDQHQHRYRPPPLAGQTREEKE